MYAHQHIRLHVVFIINTFQNIHLTISCQFIKYSRLSGIKRNVRMSHKKRRGNPSSLTNKSKNHENCIISFQQSMNNLTKSLFKRFTSSYSTYICLYFSMGMNSFFICLLDIFFSSSSPQWCKAEIMQEKGYFSTKKEKEKETL